MFWAIRRSGQGSVEGVWSSILGVPVNSIEFVGRHSEVVRLVDELREYLLTLPPGDSLRDRYESDITLWYEAVISRDDWAAGIKASTKLIQEGTIRLLG